MRNNVFLIDEELFKQSTSVSDNLDSKMLRPAIQDAQQIYLQPILGSKLLEKVYEMVDNEEIEQEGFEKYQELLETYIQPWLIQKVQALLIPIMYFKTRNAGNVQYYDNSQNNAPLNDMKWIMSRFDNNANFLSQRMTDFICANRSSFPEYCQVDSVADMHSGRDNQNYCSIHLNSDNTRDTSIKWLRSTRLHDVPNAQQ